MIATVRLCMSKLPASKFTGDDLLSWRRILSGQPKYLGGGTGIPALGIATGTLLIFLGAKPGGGVGSRFREDLAARLV